MGSQFGTDGSSYHFATNFGHKITKLYPSLVQMKCDGVAVKGLKGIKQKALVSLYDGNKLIKKTIGDLLFTDNGVSGNAIFYLSSYLVDLSNPNLVADLLPDIETDKIINSLQNKIKVYPNITGDKLLNGIVASRLSTKISTELGINNIKLSEIANAKLVVAIQKIKEYRLPIVGTMGFNNAQVTRGGINTKDIDNQTYESKLVKGLYIVGEALDVDGDCGGYNLQFAFSSAMCASEAIK